LDLNAPPPPNVVHDPFFSVTRSGGVMAKVGLAELLAAVDDGSLVDLTRMAQHQRGEVVTVLAIIRAVLRRHLAADGEAALTGADYASAWDEVCGRGAGDLYAHWADPAFLQPPVTNEPTLPKTIEGIGVQFADVGHEVKPQSLDPDPEDWVLALMNGQGRIYVKDNASGSRWGLTYVLPSDGVTIASEIRTLSDAYGAGMASDEVLAMFPATATAAPADHFVFLTTYAPSGGQIPAIDLPWPWLEAPRATRLALKDGRIIARQMTIDKPRVDVKSVNDLILDPHVPATADGIFRRIKSRAWDHKFLLNVLFGGGADGPTPPAIIRRSKLPFLRVCSLRTDQGKTTGYRERLVNVRPKGARLPPDQALLGKISERFIRSAGLLQRYGIFPALMRMQGDSADEGRATQGIARYHAAIEDIAADTVIRLALEAGGDDKAILAGIFDALDRAARLALAHGEATVPHERRRWINIAEGHGYYAWAVRHHPELNEVRPMVTESMGSRPTRDVPALSRQIFGVLQSIAGEMQGDAQIAKVLRTLPEKSWHAAYWRLMARLPNELLDDARVATAFDAIVRGLGLVAHDAEAKPAAALLAAKEYPEDRLVRLLEAGGEDASFHIQEAWRFLSAKGVSRMNWSDLAGLAVAAARGEAAVADWHRRNIAIAYARNAGAGDGAAGRTAA